MVEQAGHGRGAWTPEVAQLEQAGHHQLGAVVVPAAARRVGHDRRLEEQPPADPGPELVGEAVDVVAEPVDHQPQLERRERHRHDLVAHHDALVDAHELPDGVGGVEERELDEQPLLVDGVDEHLGVDLDRRAVVDDPHEGAAEAAVDRDVAVGVVLELGEHLGHRLVDELLQVVAGPRHDGEGRVVAALGLLRLGNGDQRDGGGGVDLQPAGVEERGVHHAVDLAQRADHQKGDPVGLAALEAAEVARVAGLVDRGRPAEGLQVRLLLDEEPEHVGLDQELAVRAELDQEVLGLLVGRLDLQPVAVGHLGDVVGQPPAERRPGRLGGGDQVVLVSHAAPCTLDPGSSSCSTHARRDHRQWSCTHTPGGSSTVTPREQGRVPGARRRGLRRRVRRGDRLAGRRARHRAPLARRADRRPARDAGGLRRQPDAQELQLLRRLLERAAAATWPSTGGSRPTRSATTPAPGWSSS